MSGTDTSSSDDAPGSAPATPGPTAAAPSTPPAPHRGRGPRGNAAWQWGSVLALLAVAALALWWFSSGRGTGEAPTASRVGPMGSTGSTPPASAAASAAAGLALSASQVERGVQRARETVAEHADDATAWAMLAHGEAMLGHFDEAGKAYAKLLALRPRDAQVHAEAAEDLGAAHGGSLDGEPQRLIARALELDPANFKARVLAGKAAFEHKRYAEAAGEWERALPAAPEGAVRRQLETSIAEARSLAAPGGKAKASGGLAFVAGRVTVAKALASRLQPDDAVFVFARPAEGSRMPVALLRRRAAELPLDFALDDTLALVPQTRLSQFKQVIVGVHVSRRGDAIATAGDLRGQIGPVPVGSSGLHLEIDDVVK